ncbi:DUF2076 family protein [Buchnera aphidicola (Hormaphis cornu)]|nr:DUF2076 family protein [Buchnera aphidicola (Hormaphis cornu)]
MQFEERKLIENLFHRLKQIESKYPNKNKSAEDLISSLLKEQPNSSYYIVQTVLIQEVVIKKLNTEIETLKNKISNLDSSFNKKEPSFLSGIFKRRSSPVFSKNRSNSFVNEKIIDNNASSEGILHNTTKNSSAGSFISSALQTAAGVAGGIVMGNALLNLFHKNKPEEDVIETMQNSSFSSLDSHDFNNLDQFCSTEPNNSLLHTSGYGEDDQANFDSEETILNDDEILLNNNDSTFNSDIDDDDLI